MRIFIGGASDVADETKELRRICEVNKNTLAVLSGAEIEILSWQKVLPGQGNPQQIILDHSQFHDTDVFVFALWHSFGSPPGKGRIATWRKKMPNGRKNFEYQSGTEEEIEVALEAVGKTNRKQRIIIYKCDRPVPQKELNTEQWNKLAFYFEHRIRKLALYANFSTVEELGSKFSAHILEAALVVSTAERRASKAISSLSKEYKGKGLAGAGNIVEQYVAEECDNMSDILDSVAGANREFCRMRTSNLYDQIVQLMEKADVVKIVDLDIRRWNELLNEADRVYSLNYSQEILNRSAAVAKRNNRYALQRILAVRNTDIANPKNRERIIRILQHIERFIQKENVQDQISVRVYFDQFDLRPKPTRRETAAVFSEVQRSIRSIQDIVLCATGGKKILLREEIEFDNPKSAFLTRGSISINEAEVERVESSFIGLWRFSWKLNDAIVKLKDIH